MLRRDGDQLVNGSRQAALGEVRGLRERFDPWTGRAELLVEGPGWRLPIGAGYGTTRQHLRRWLPDVRFASDWMDGRFPGLPGGLPPNLALGLGVAAAALIAAVLTWRLGIAWGLGAALLATWPLGRLRDGLVVQPAGLRAGPPWAPLVPWFDIEAVHVRQGPWRSWVWTRGPGGGGAVALPTVLLPAVRARVRRLGGLELTDATEDLDDQYLRWRAPAVGMPWGIGLGTLLVAWFTPVPWTALTAGAAAMLGTTLLGLMVLWRSRGWGTGSVLAGTLLYGLVLAVVGMGAAGWLGGS